MRLLTEHSEELIEHYSERLLRGSGYSADGFAAGYASHRPSPPAALLDVLCVEAQAERPRLVVDFGSGTGLSTRAWADRADEVVGVEASPEMRAQAEAATPPGNVRFVQAYAQETGLPDGVADVVTCSQSFHWMEPEPTLAEAARILRPGRRVRRVRLRLAAGRATPMSRLRSRSCCFGRAVCDPAREAGPAHAKEWHLERIRARRPLPAAREVVLHSRERGSAERIVGMALSLGPMIVLLQEGRARKRSGSRRARSRLPAALGEREVEMFLAYRVRLGVR